MILDATGIAPRAGTNHGALERDTPTQATGTTKDEVTRRSPHPVEPVGRTSSDKVESPGRGLHHRAASLTHSKAYRPNSPIPPAAASTNHREWVIADPMISCGAARKRYVPCADSKQGRWSRRPHQPSPRASPTPAASQCRSSLFELYKAGQRKTNKLGRDSPVLHRHHIDYQTQGVVSLHPRSKLRRALISTVGRFEHDQVPRTDNTD